MLPSTRSPPAAPRISTISRALCLRTCVKRVLPKPFFAAARVNPHFLFFCVDHCIVYALVSNIIKITISPIVSVIYQLAADRPRDKPETA